MSGNDETKPTWQRILTGDAKEGYDTKRALQTRHIMMIGVSPSARPRLAPLTFPPQPLVVQLARASSSALARCVFAPLPLLHPR